MPIEIDSPALTPADRKWFAENVEDSLGQLFGTAVGYQWPVPPPRPLRDGDRPCVPELLTEPIYAGGSRSGRRRAGTRHSVVPSVALAFADHDSATKGSYMYPYATLS